MRQCFLSCLDTSTRRHPGGSHDVRDIVGLTQVCTYARALITYAGRQTRLTHLQINASRAPSSFVCIITCVNIAAMKI